MFSRSQTFTVIQDLNFGRNVIRTKLFGKVKHTLYVTDKQKSFPVGNSQTHAWASVLTCVRAS